MTSLTGIRAGGALTLLLLAPSIAPAAWDNVFQVTCCGHKRVAAYASPCCPAPCPTTCCAPPPPCCPAPTFVQRSFCQPVTTMQAFCFSEPVTTYRTSHYWEPVTSYSMSCYVDPCTGCTQQVAVPTTSLRMRTQCNAVQSWVQRVGYRPVTTYRQSFYWEQVQAPACPTCGPVASAPCPGCGPSAPVVAAPAPSGTPPLNLPQAPALGENRSPPPPALGESRDQYYMPPAANPSGLRTSPVAAPLKLDRMASLNAPVTGQIVTANYSPRAGAQVVFVNASRQDVRETTTADAAGRYQANLPAGEWYVYVDQTYHNRIDVTASVPRQITIVSR
jgi:hypothetical protein